MPFWLWPNLLSLHAPLIALLWQVFFVRCFHGHENIAPSLLLVCAVWLIYVADRVLDAAQGTAHQPRHDFYRRHWRDVRPVWIAVLACTAWLAHRTLAPAMFRDGLAVLSAVSCYFAAVHLAPRGIRLRFPKEVAVGFLFALGASLPVWTSLTNARSITAVVLFSCLCWINCIAIQQWERGSPAWPVAGIAALFALSAGTLLYSRLPALAGAQTASALALVALDRSRRRFSADALRVLADAALLSPALFFPFAGIRI